MERVSSRRDALKAGGLLLPAFLLKSFLPQVPSIGQLNFPQIPDLGELDGSGGFVTEGRFKNVFYPGMGTDQGELSDTIDPLDDNFVSLRQTLLQYNWRLKHSIFFTWGKGGLLRYSSKDTIGDPDLMIEVASKEILNYPGEEFNLIGFSLGGIIATGVALQHPEKVRSLNLISTPVRGIEYSFSKWLMLESGKKVISSLTDSPIDQEVVSEYLFKRWEDKKFHQELDNFGKTFTDSGKSLNIPFSINDPLFNEQSVMVSGAKYYPLSLGWEVLANPFEIHSRPQKDERISRALARSIGFNPEP